MKLEAYIESGKLALDLHNGVENDPETDVIQLLHFALMVKTRWRLYMLNTTTTREIWDMLRLPEHQGILDTLLETCVLFTNVLDTTTDLNYQTLANSYKTTLGQLQNIKDFEDEDFYQRCIRNQEDPLSRHPWLVWLYFLGQHAMHYLSGKE